MDEIYRAKNISGNDKKSIDKNFLLA